MSEEMKVPVNEMKLAKYETFIQGIDDHLKKFMLRPMFVLDSSRVLSLAGSTALALVYDYGKCNDYAKAIIDKSTLAIQDDYKNDLWKKEYPTYDSLGDIKGKIDAAKKFVELCGKPWSDNAEEKYKFIFWALMVLTVDQSDAEEHLSLICDLANMLHITDDEFEDIIQVVKTVCNGSMSEYKFKSKKVSEVFNGVLSEYAS